MSDQKIKAKNNENERKKFRISEKSQFASDNETILSKCVEFRKHSKQKRKVNFLINFSYKIIK